MATTIFDKPLDGELAEAKQAIANISPVNVQLKSTFTRATITRNHSCRLGKFIQISLLFNVTTAFASIEEITDSNAVPKPKTFDQTATDATTIADIQSTYEECRLRITKDGTMHMQCNRTGNVLFTGMYIAEDFA